MYVVTASNESGERSSLVCWQGDAAFSYKDELGLPHAVDDS